MSFRASLTDVSTPRGFAAEAVPEWEVPPLHPGWLALDRPSARPFEVHRAGAKDAAHCLRSVGHDRYGLALADDPVYEVRCGRRARMVLFDRCFLEADSMAGLGTHRTTPAVIASRSEQTGEFTVACLVTGTPGDVAGEVRLSLFRTTGRLAFGGLARIEAGCASFALHAASRPGAFALELAGRFEARGLAVDTALSSPGIVVPKRRPTEE